MDESLAASNLIDQIVFVDCWRQNTCIHNLFAATNPLFVDEELKVIPTFSLSSLFCSDVIWVNFNDANILGRQFNTF